MQDALQRQLEKGDIYVGLGSYSATVGIVTQQEPGFVRGINIKFVMAPTKEEAIHRRVADNSYYNVRYELKFGRNAGTICSKMCHISSSEYCVQHVRNPKKGK